MAEEENAALGDCLMAATCGHAGTLSARQADVSLNHVRVAPSRPTGFSVLGDRLLRADGGCRPLGQSGTVPLALATPRLLLTSGCCLCSCWLRKRHSPPWTTLLTPGARTVTVSVNPGTRNADFTMVTRSLAIRHKKVPSAVFQISDFCHMRRGWDKGTLREASWLPRQLSR